MVSNSKSAWGDVVYGRKRQRFLTRRHVYDLDVLLPWRLWLETISAAKKGAHSWFTPPNGKHTTRNHSLVGHLLYMYLRLFSRGCSILVGWDPMALHIIITTLFAPCCHHPVATCRGTCQKDDKGCTHYAVTASVQHSLSKTACHLQTGWRHDTDRPTQKSSCGIMQHRWFYHIYEMRDFPPNPCNYCKRHDGSELQLIRRPRLWNLAENLCRP